MFLRKLSLLLEVRLLHLALAHIVLVVADDGVHFVDFALEVTAFPFSPLLISDQIDLLLLQDVQFLSQAVVFLSHFVKSLALALSLLLNGVSVLARTLHFVL